MSCSLDIFTLVYSSKKPSRNIQHSPASFQITFKALTAQHHIHSPGKPEKCIKATSHHLLNPPTPPTQRVRHLQTPQRLVCLFLCCRYERSLRYNLQASRRAYSAPPGLEPGCDTRQSLCYSGLRRRYGIAPVSNFPGPGAGTRPATGPTAKLCRLHRSQFSLSYSNPAPPGGTRLI